MLDLTAENSQPTVTTQNSISNARKLKNSIYFNGRQWIWAAGNHKTINFITNNLIFGNRKSQNVRLYDKGFDFGSGESQHNFITMDLMLATEHHQKQLLTTSLFFTAEIRKLFCRNRPGF